ncbi:MAG: pyrroline-5-carboxylate reductase [Chloroflexota bacterium]
MAELPSIVFLGAGQIAEAIIGGVLDSRLVSPSQITATDVRPDRLAELASSLGIRTSHSNTEAASHGEIVILTVKPQDVTRLLAEVGPVLGAEQLVVSVAAGVPIRTIQRSLPGPTPVIRVMPNTPALVRAGMAVLALGEFARPRDEELATKIFSAVGQAVTLPEAYLNAVTGLSGSGPAFVALFIEALIEGGVRVGLARDVATTLAVQTTLGTAQMILETQKHPAILREMVSSPGGTTMAGVHALELGGLRGTVMNAIVAATERSRELGKIE